MITGAISSAVSGIMSGIRSLNQRAERTANFHANAQQALENPASADVGREVDQLVDDSVGRIIDKRSVEANLNVIKTQDEMLGSIIDILK